MSAVTVTTGTTETPAPATDEQPTPETEEALEPTEDSTDWGAVESGLDTDEEEPTGEEEPAPSEEAPAPPVEEPAAEEPTPDPAPAPTPAPVESAPEPDVDALWRDREQALVKDYAISEELSEAISLDPGKHLPQLLAGVQAKAERTIWDNLNQILPDTVKSVLTRDNDEQERRGRFFEAWPDLKAHLEANPEAEETIQRMRTLFTNQPGAAQMTEEQIIHQVGAAAVVALGVKTASAPTPTPTPTPPAKPTARTAPGARGTSAQPQRLGAFESFDASLDEDGAETSKGATTF